MKWLAKQHSVQSKARPSHELQTDPALYSCKFYSASRPTNIHLPIKLAEKAETKKPGRRSVS